MKTAAGPEINFFTPTEVDMSEAARDRQRRRAGGTVPNENSLLLFHSARNVGVIVAVRQNPKELCIKYVCGGGSRNPRNQERLTRQPGTLRRYFEQRPRSERIDRIAWHHHTLALSCLMVGVEGRLPKARRVPMMRDPGRRRRRSEWVGWIVPVRNRRRR